VFVLGVLEV